MVRLSTESTPRERLARIVVLMKRTRRYARSTIAIAAALVLASLLLALSTKRIYRSEATVVYREVVRAGREGESPAQRAARLGPRLKELILSRGSLTSVIEQFGLYPELAERSMLEAIAEMQKNVSFRARTQDTFALSFSHHDPATAQAVTKRLAELMIDDYSKDNLTTAALNHDVLRRELDEANHAVEDASRALARFLAKHPQFTWGINDSPYAPTAPQPGVAAPIPQPMQANRSPQASRVPADPMLARLLHRLGQIDAELAGPGRPGSPPQLPVNLSDAQKQRDAAAAALLAAETDLATKLQKVTAVHPDAIAAQSKVARARSTLAAADKTLDLLRTGGVAPQPAAGDDTLDPGRRAALEEERRQITAQISARRSVAPRGRAGTATNTAPAPAATADAGAATGPNTTDPEIVELETEWHKLRLDLERARDHYRKVQDKERGANMTATAAEQEAEEALVVADPAYLPVKPDRGRGRVFFAGSFAAIFLALAYAGSRVLLCETILDEGDVEALGGPPLLVSVPHIPEPKTSTALTKRDSWLPSTPPPPPEKAEETGPTSRPPESGSIEIRFEEAAAAPPSEPRIIPLGAPPPPPAEVEDDPLPPKRIRMETLPYGATLADYLAKAQREAPPPAEEPAAEPPHVDPIDESDAEEPKPESKPGALSVRTPNAGAVMLASEVEVVGTPFDPESEGALELVRGAPPAVLGALRVLRHRLEQKRGEGPLVVSVVSPALGEGKTAVAARLAMTLAEAERARVVLVEGNLGRPRLASMLGVRVPEEMGFSAQLRRHMSGRWEPWSVLRIGASLYVLAEPATEAAFPTALHSTWFEGAIRALRESYDYVVIDGCAVLGSGDANVLEDVSDVCVLLARAGMTKGSDLARAAKQIGDRRMFGVVLNDMHEENQRKWRIGA